VLTFRPAELLRIQPSSTLTPIVSVAIAFPLMLGSRPRPSPDKRAQSSLKVTSSDAKSWFLDSGSYQSATASDLAEEEPGYSFVDQQVESKLPKTVSVAATKTTFVAAAKSETGRCFFIFDTEVVGTRYAETTDRPCAAANAPTPASAVWTAAWPVPPLTD
jgi:hypothetical protein